MNRLSVIRLICSTGCLAGSLFAREPDLTFTHLSVEGGLSNNIVWNIVQDRRGFMWFSTFDGLNRYDGYAVMVFKWEPGNPNGLHRNVDGIYEDRNGTIWIGSQNSGSLSRYDPESGRFFHYPTESDSLKSLPGNGVTAFHEDRPGSLWLAVIKDENHKKFDRPVKFDPARGTFKRIRIEPDEPDVLDYRTFYADKTGCLWINTDCDGLIRFDPRTSESVRYRHEPGNSHSLSDDMVGSLYEDRDGSIWIVTAHGYLNKFDYLSNRTAAGTFLIATPKDCCVVFGNEGDGISEAVLRECSRPVAIPMAHGVDSFNVACASAVVLYEAMRQRGSCG